MTPTAVLGVSSGPPSEICIANLTVTVFHDQNGNGVFDQDEQTLSGWTIEVTGTRGGPITTGENGTAWIGNLNNGETYVVRLVFPPESGWFPTTRSSITWEAVCGEAQFGVTRFTLPTTGSELRTNTGAPTDSLRTLSNDTPVKQEGLLSLPGLTIPLQPTSVEGRELLVPEWAGGVTRSPAGGLRINWHAGQFMLAHPPKVGDTVSVTYAGETVRYRVDLVTVAPADAESTPLQTVPRGSLLLVTCTGAEWSSRLLVWASRVE